MSLTNQSIYDAYKRFSAYQEGLKAVAQHPDEYEKVAVSTGMFTITPLGNLFKEVCSLLELSDSVYVDKIADFFESLRPVLLSWDLGKSEIIEREWKLI